MRLLVAVVQVAGHEQHELALRVADLDPGEVAVPGSPLSVNVNQNVVARLAVEPADALADQGVERCRARQRVEQRVVVAGDEGELLEVEAVLVEVDLEVVRPDVDVAVQLEAMRDAHAVVGEDAAATGHPPAAGARAA